MEFSSSRVFAGRLTLDSQEAPIQLHTFVLIAGLVRLYEAQCASATTLMNGSSHLSYARLELHVR
ncbi:hypothetical protein HMPREF2807_03370 [Corynebacterium sp. HMSC074A09]|nr:hypothetical protein HMPREF2807_03370 [Corynebacterium sp. HMSC074A09]